MKSLHLKKLAGMDKRLRTWGKSPAEEDHELASGSVKSHHKAKRKGKAHTAHRQHNSHTPHHHDPRRRSSLPGLYSSSSSPPLSSSPSLAEDSPAFPVGASPAEEPSSCCLLPPSPPIMREQEAARHALLTGTPLPPLPPLAAVHTPHKHTSEFDTRSPPPSPTAGPTPGPSSSSSSSAPSHSSSGGQLLLGGESGHAWSGGTKGKRQLEEKLREMKHRELSLREERKRECERRKEVERQLKALQKERYLQGLKVKYLETKLEKADGNKSDIRRRAKMESQASSSLQKEVEALQMNLSSREKALREKEEELSEIKRHCSRLMEGGTENCSLDELEQLEQILGKISPLLSSLSPPLSSLSSSSRLSGLSRAQARYAFVFWAYRSLPGHHQRTAGTSCLSESRKR